MQIRAIVFLFTIVAHTSAVTICDTSGVSQVTAQESNTRGWKVYLPDPRNTAYNGGAIPQTHFDGLSKLLDLTNKVITGKLVGNAAAGAKILTMMQKTPIVFSGSGMGWSVNGMIGSCKEAINTGCVLGQNYQVIADHYLSFATYTASSTTLSSMLLHELAHVFDRSLLVNEASFDAQYGNTPNTYSLAEAVRAAYTGNKILVVPSKGENLVSKAKIEALGYDVITHAQNDICSKGQYFCGSGGSAGTWLQGASSSGAACAQKTKAKCFVGNPVGPNDGKDDYAFSSSLEYFAELTESITQGTVVNGSTMGQNDKWPYNNANLQAEDPVGFAAVSAMWNLTEAEFDAAVAAKCPASSEATAPPTTPPPAKSPTTPPPATVVVITSKGTVALKMSKADATALAAKPTAKAAFASAVAKTTGLAASKITITAVYVDGVKVARRLANATESTVTFDWETKHTSVVTAASMDATTLKTHIVAEMKAVANLTVVVTAVPTVTVVAQPTTTKAPAGATGSAGPASEASGTVSSVGMMLAAMVMSMTTLTP